MDESVQELLAAGLSSATMNSYRSGLSRFMSFCGQVNLSPFPLTESTLCRFVAFLVSQHLSPGTICLYLSALRFHQIAGGGIDPLMSDMAQLHYAASQDQYTVMLVLRLPITMDVLVRLFHRWRSLPDQYEASLLWAAATLGFLGFLRVGEFTAVPGSDQVPLSLADVRVDDHTNPTFLAVTLRANKTDPFGAGHTLYVGCTESRICPVAAVLAFVAVRPQVPGPLFVHRNGSPFTRADLVREIRSALTGSGLDLARFTGHSFRIGAASSAAQVGLDESLIQTLGRWRSSAFQRYIRTPTATLIAVSRVLVQGHTNLGNQTEQHV